jgi:hypothetical protein
LNPQASAITGDYEGRLYSYGLFGRPRDQIAFSYQHQVYSRYIADPVDTGASCHSGLVCIRHAVNSYISSYTANIIAGVYVSLGAQYIDHPSASYSPNTPAYGPAAAPVSPQRNIDHSVNFLASLFTVF